MSLDVFDSQKKTCLNGVDLSRKGSIDAPILDLVSFINDQANLFTTSSCSGRLIVVDNDVNGIIKKQGCKWILTSHDCITLQQLKENLVNAEGNAVFKFEPFVMHVQCRTLDDAQLMLSTAVGSGYRNSGISVGHKGKFITAVRSTHSLEVPLTCCGKLLVSDEYLEFLVKSGNDKMTENLDRINRLFSNLKKSIQEKSDKKSSSKTKIDKSVNRTPSDRNKTSSVIDKETCVVKHSDSFEDLTQCSMFNDELNT